MDHFEKACNDIESGLYNLETTQENAIEFLRNAKTATATFCQGRFVNKIKALAEEFPDEVQIVHTNPDGSIVVHLPVSYIRIRRFKREMTEEQREAARERLKEARSKIRSTSIDEIDAIEEEEDEDDE